MLPNLKRRDARSWIGFLFLLTLIASLATAPVPAFADHRPNHPAGSNRSTTVPENEDSDDESDDTTGEEESDSSERARTEDSDDEDLDDGDADRQEACGDDGSEADDEGGCEKPTVQGQKPAPKDVVPKANGTTTGSAGGAAVSGNTATTPGVREGGILRTAGASGNSPGRARGGRFLFRGETGLHSVQPSLAIRVDALNDADEDGIYSDSEIAAAPGADINFKALITNTGSTQFEIVAVNHTLANQGGRVQIGVCGDLGGVTVAPGDSVACSFSVADYSPPSGESAVSTVAASAIEFGGAGNRGASDSDNSTVATLLADEVLAAAVERVPGLAFTGADAARLLVLALVLLGAGGGLTSLARLRGNTTEQRVVRIGPFRLPGMRSTQAPTPRPDKKASRS